LGVRGSAEAGAAGQRGGRRCGDGRVPGQCQGRGAERSGARGERVGVGRQPVRGGQPGELRGPGRDHGPGGNRGLLGNRAEPVGTFGGGGPLVQPRPRGEQLPMRRFGREPCLNGDPGLAGRPLRGDRPVPLLGPRGDRGVQFGQPARPLGGAGRRPDELRGEVITAFVVLKQGHEPSEELRKELLNTVRSELGPVAVIGEIEFVGMVPKTRSGKIMRRVLKAVTLGRDPGDVSTIEDEGSVEEAREAWHQLKTQIAR